MTPLELLWNGWRSTYVTTAGQAGGVHPDDQARVSSEWMNAVSRETEWRSEFRCSQQDGAVTWVSVRTSRFLRFIAGRRKARAADRRMPPLVVNW